MGLVIIHHEGAWNLWSTEIDAAAMADAVTEERLREILKEREGTQGLHQRERGLERAKSIGTSHMLYHSLEELVAGNHAGRGGKTIPFETFVKRHLTLRTPKVDRLYTITCVCGIQVKVVEATRVKDPHAIETEGAASVRMCPGCHPEMFQIRSKPDWWTKRLPGDIPQRTLDAWEAEDQRRRDRMAQAADNNRKRTK